MPYDAETRDRVLDEAMSDFPTYAEDWLKIRPKDGSLVPLRLNAVQRIVHEAAEDQRARTGKVRKIVLKARQPGISTYVEGRFYWRVSFSKGSRAFILTHKDEATNNLFEMAKRFHQHSPWPPTTTASNANELRFGRLDSSYKVGTAKAEGVGRSDTIQFFHASEVAFWPNADKHAAGALQAVPDSPGTEVWLESTANGKGGLFYNMVQKARHGEGDYELIFIPWFHHEEYVKAAPDGWVPPEGWREYGEAYGLDLDRLHWGYAKNAELAVGIGATLDEPCWLFRQEYPASVDDAFQAGGEHSFIRGDLVAAAMLADYPDTDFDSPLVFGVDIAHGGGDKTRVVDRCGRRMGHLVNETWDESDEMVIAGKLVKLIDWREPDMVFVDVTGGYGAGVVDRLREQGYSMVRGINFGSGAGDKKYANKRAEMWDSLRVWLTEGADIVKDDGLEADITAPTAKPDSSGRLVLEKKEDMRKRVGFSPDGGDAAALTFAAPVRRKSAPAEPAYADAEYPVLDY